MSKLPILFFGHGSPMNLVLDNDFTRSVINFGKTLPRPRAIISISAHWFINDTLVTGSKTPATIHDFYGFPKELYEYSYPAPGDPQLAQELCKLIKTTSVRTCDKWGLDHGTWTILKHLFPKADIPIIQLSINYSKPPLFHFKLGQELQSLREKNVLIIGSGNMVHNLGVIDYDINAPPRQWTLKWDQRLKELLLQRNFAQLIHYEKIDSDYRLPIPNEDHYLPLLYVLGLASKDEPLSFVYEGIHHGTISMRSVQIG